MPDVAPFYKRLVTLPPRDDRVSSASRGYGRQWQRLRKMKVAANPVCEVDGCEQPTTQVDHIISMRVRAKVARRLDELLSLCTHHHSLKTMMIDGGCGNERVDLTNVCDPRGLVLSMLSSPTRGLSNSIPPLRGGLH